MHKFIPFSKPAISNAEIDEIIDTLKSGWLSIGPKTKIFEDKLKRYLDCEYVIAVNSCTAALHLCLVALDIGSGDEVITTPFTFCSTVNVILHTGAKPVLVDIDPKTFNINPDKIEKKISKNTKAIIPVHYAGQPCNMEKIMAVSKKYNLKVIEDAAHALGSEYKKRKIGTIGDFTCFSFYATKNITTGEGGAIATDNKVLAKIIRELSLHGISKDAWKRYSKEGSWYYEVLYPGYKYNFTDIQASLGIHQLKKLEKFINKREKLAIAYNKLLKDIPQIQIPYIKDNVKAVRHLYPVLINDKNIKRERFIEELKKRNIGCSVHFIPIHLHPYYRKRFGFKPGDFPITEYVYDRIVSLPLFYDMTIEDVKYVCNSIKEIIKK